MNQPNLQPRLEHLNQEFVLVQAWKKTSDYIRNHNWFSDTLDLDYTTINLKPFLERLCKQSKTPADWKSDCIYLVPAPKASSGDIHAWNMGTEMQNGSATSTTGPRKSAGPSDGYSIDALPC